MARLCRADCSGPGIARRRHGRGFSYTDPDGRPVRDPDTLARIKALGIPPAWRDVWICPRPNGHLQAVGVDAAGRRQYLYHEQWRIRRDQAKFDHMLEFARVLPDLREQAARQLREEAGPTRDLVLACAIRLLDRGFFRVGSEGYAEQNQTYGLATMEKRHVTVDGAEISFDYASKSGKRRIVAVADPEVAGVVAALKRHRGGGARPHRGPPGAGLRPQRLKRATLASAPRSRGFCRLPHRGAAAPHQDLRSPDLEEATPGCPSTSLPPSPGRTPGREPPTVPAPPAACPRSSTGTG